MFEQRLLPIFSRLIRRVVQCISAESRLKNSLTRHTSKRSRRCDLGLIDPTSPRSRHLALIRMGGATRTSLIQKATRESELEAFADWIRRSAADPKLRDLPKLKAEELAKPTSPNEVIRHGRVDRVLESFTNTIWPMRFRCMSCHSEGSDQNRKLVAEHGDRVAWFKAGGPRATLDYLRKSGLLNADDPEQSLLLRKPLNEVKHGGGVVSLRDQGYKATCLVDDYPASSKRVRRFQHVAKT